MSTNKIAAVVVTYNRFQLVQRTIGCLRHQTLKLDSIIVVNNSSTDGTKEWLDMQSDLIVIHQENVGGSGGFYRGIDEAYRRGFDWIWCMDDDVFPHSDCLERYLEVVVEDTGIVVPTRYIDGVFFSGEYKTLNLKNPFRPLHLNHVKEKDVEAGKPFEIDAMSFEGPIIRREVVEKIGLPNKDLFILYDDTDYSYRTRLAGFKVLSHPKAILDKHNFNVNRNKRETVAANKWKLWYHIRNTAYFNHHYGKNWLVRNWGGYDFILKMLFAMLKNIPVNKKYSWDDIITMLRMDLRGRKEILGKM